MSTVTNSHEQTIIRIRRELAEIDAALKPLQDRRCELRADLLSEIEALQQEYTAATRRIDPGEEMYRARENWGVEDA